MNFSDEIGPTLLVCYSTPRDGDKTRDSGERVPNHPGRRRGTMGEDVRTRLGQLDQRRKTVPVNKH